MVFFWVFRVGFRAQGVLGLGFRVWHLRCSLRILGLGFSCEGVGLGLKAP